MEDFGDSFAKLATVKAVTALEQQLHQVATNETVSGLEQRLNQVEGKLDKVLAALEKLDGTSRRTQKKTPSQ